MRRRTEKKEVKQGIFLALQPEIIEFIKRHDPTGQMKTSNGLLYLVRMIKKIEDEKRFGAGAEGKVA